MKRLTTSQMLAQLGLERRRSTTNRVVTATSMVGLGAALGVGAMVLSRLTPVRKLFKLDAVKAPAPTTPQSAPTLRTA